MVIPTKNRARAIVERLNRPAPVESAIAIFARANQPAILESSRPSDPYGRFSILAADPVATISLTGPDTPDPLSAFAAAMDRYPVSANGSGEIPFIGGWIGFLNYEAGLPFHKITPHATSRPATPLTRFGLYDAAAVYDHQKDTWFLTAIEWPAPLANRSPSVSQRFRVLHERLEAASRLQLSEPPSPQTTRPVPNMSRKDYFDKLRRVKQYIEAGDVYQVNLTQRFTARTTASPLDLYRRLRASSPSSHAALLMWDDIAILSSSPELFLSLRDGHVVTRPIKGTRPRTSDARADAAARRELSTSDKERAELTMIVDLLRNDLGRVCSFGSVRVTEPGQIEEHPTVFHRVATIEGDLRSEMGWLDLLRAAFPGGSVTGAPKIRAMQIIRELEPTPRGVYCGAIGWIGADGSMSLNLAIRTMVQRGESVSLHAGGGIVAQSTADAEYQETLAKLRGMLRALNADGPETSPTIWPSASRAVREAVPAP